VQAICFKSEEVVAKVREKDLYERMVKMRLKVNKKVYLEKEFYIGLFSLLLGIFLSYAPDRNDGLYLIYPRFVFGGMVVIGILMVLMALIGKGGNTITEIKMNIHELVLLILFLFIRPSIERLGLYTTLFLVNMIVTVMVKKDKSRGAMIKTLMFNVILMLALYQVFAVVLNVSTPKAWLI